MSKFLQIVYDFFKGMSSFVAPEKLPKTVLQVIENYELMLQYGNLVKRNGYENLLTSGLTALKGMVEFLDKNDGRQLLIQDGTGLEESVYSGGYGAIAAISNDERTAGSTVDQMFPIVHNNEVRSPAGIGSDNYRPFIYQYIDAVSRFNDSVNVSIAAGKYLSERFINSLSYVNVNAESGTSEVADTGLDSGWYAVYYAFVLDGYIRCVPQLADVVNVGDLGVLKITAQWAVAARNYNPRVTAIDIFVSIRMDKSSEDPTNYPAYYLQRIDINEDSDEYIELEGTFEDDNPPTYIEFTDDFSTWETVNLADLWMSFTYDGTDYVYRLGGRTENSTKVQYEFDETAAAALQNQTVTVKIFSRWKDYSPVSAPFDFVTFYDNYYQVLGAEMFTKLDIPQGDEGLSDYKHKYGVIANNRYFGFGFSDNRAYYSPPYSFDVLPALNIIRPVKKVVGCARAGRDVYMYYKTGGSRVSVLSNTNIDQDDDFSDVGSCGMKSIAQIDEDSHAFMSYKGPYLVQGRRKIYIGEDIRTWFIKTGSLEYFTNAQKEACVAHYDQNKRQLLFSFPTYTDSHYTAGIVFKFDFGAYERSFQPWLVLKTDIPLYSFALSEDIHLLAASTTKIVDFDGSDPDETVATRLIFHLIKVKKRVRMLFHKLYLDITTDDTPTINAYFDGSSSATALTAINTDGETNIKQIKESMKLEITTAASANSVEVSSLEIKVMPRKF